MKAFLNTLRIIVIIILSFYILHKISRYFYTSICDKKVPSYILKDKDFLKTEKMDTIYVINSNILECGNDPRLPVDMSIIRPEIEKQLKEIGYRYILFNNNPDSDIYYGMLSQQKEKPFYRVTIWTDMYRLIPHYEILIQESYFNGDSTINFESTYGYSFWGANTPEIKQVDHIY